MIVIMYHIRTHQEMSLTLPKMNFQRLLSEIRKHIPDRRWRFLESFDPDEEPMDEEYPELSSN